MPRPPAPGSAAPPPSPTHSLSGGQDLRDEPAVHGDSRAQRVSGRYGCGFGGEPVGVAGGFRRVLPNSKRIVAGAEERERQRQLLLLFRAQPTDIPSLSPPARRP